MRGIILKDCIRLFGFKEGFSFWFTWSFTHPVQMAYWKLTKKEWCAHAGYHCEEFNKGKKCEYHHFKGLPDRPKLEIWDMCCYCGALPASKVIFNPNSIYADLYAKFKTKIYWKICLECDEAIELSQQLDMAMGFAYAAEKHKMSEKAKDFAETKIKKSIEKIKKFDEETGKKSFVGVMTKTESGIAGRDLISGKEL